MLVLNKEYYLAWCDIPESTVRYWVRLWQDGFYSGSHPEWAFSPLTLTGLGILWPMFSPVQGEPDFFKNQRHAIRDLARKRTSLPDGIRFTCPISDDLHKWNEYWTNVAASSAHFRIELFERLTALLCSSCDPDYRAISEVTAVLAGELLLTGYSDYELFVRTGGIFDPRHKKQKVPTVDRTRGLLEHLKQRPMYEFIVWTEIVKRDQPLSAGMSRRIAPRELPSPEDWKGVGDGFVRVSGRPLAIFRGESTHSITAFLNHRVRASQRFHERATKFGITGLRLAEDSLAIRLPLIDRKPWKHSPPRISVFQYLPRPDHTIEPEAFAKAMDTVNDDPEETIRVLCEAFEKKLGNNWPKKAGHLYIKGLQSALEWRLLATAQETYSRWVDDPNAPTWLQNLDVENRLDFLRIASEIRQSGRHADWLLAERFALVGGQDAQYFTPAWITGWLYITKGIRNREVHEGPWPIEIRCITAFLAKLLLYVFVSCFPKLP